MIITNICLVQICTRLFKVLYYVKEVGKLFCEGPYSKYLRSFVGHTFSVLITQCC